MGSDDGGGRQCSRAAGALGGAVAMPGTQAEPGWVCCVPRPACVSTCACVWWPGVCPSRRGAVLRAHLQASLGASVPAAWKLGLPSSLLLSQEPGTLLSPPALGWDWLPRGEAVERMRTQGGGRGRRTGDVGLPGGGSQKELHGLRCHSSR